MEQQYSSTERKCHKVKEEDVEGPIMMEIEDMNYMVVHRRKLQPQKVRIKKSSLSSDRRWISAFGAEG